MIEQENMVYELSDGSTVRILKETNEFQDEYMDFDVEY